jgi:superoxide dismutase, Fe-Mn family
MNATNLKDRREFLRNAGLLTLAGMASSLFTKTSASPPLTLTQSKSTDSHSSLALLPDTPFTLPPLPYSYDALEPYIDKTTMEIHHDKHHGAYVANLNKAVAENHLENIPLPDLIKKASTYPVAIRNNGGGHWNHSFFWKIMKHAGGGTPSGALADGINSAFGSFENFKTAFNDAATKRFGSGWAWLVKNKEGKLEIGSTPNQDNPLMDVSDLKGEPVMGIDVWEHAYYLKYQNKRADYINAWWNVINWDEVQKNFSSGK